MLALLAKLGRTYTLNSNGNRFAEVHFEGGPSQLSTGDRRIDVKVRDGWKGSEETRAPQIKALARIQGIEKRRLPPLLSPIDPERTPVGTEVWILDPDRVWPESATVLEPPNQARTVVKFGPGAHAGMAGATRSIFTRVVYAKRDAVPTVDEVISYEAGDKQRRAEDATRAKADEKAMRQRRKEADKAARALRPGTPVSGSTYVTVEHMDPPVHGAVFRVLRTSKAADPLLKHTGGDVFLTRVKGSPKSRTPVWGVSLEQPDWHIASASEPGPVRDPELDPIATLTDRELAESARKVGNPDRKRLLETEERRRKRGGEPPKRTVLSAQPPTHRDPQGRKRGTLAVSDHRVLERQAAEKERAQAERQEAFTAAPAAKTSLAGVGKLPAAAPAAPVGPVLNATDRMFLKQVGSRNAAGLLYHADAFKPVALARLKGLAERGLVVEVKPGKYALPEHAGLSPSAAEEQGAARKAHFEHRVSVARFDAKVKGAPARGALSAADRRLLASVRRSNDVGSLLFARGTNAADRRLRKHLESLAERGELVLVPAHGESPAGYALNAPAPATPAPVVAAAAEKLADASGHLESALEHADKASEAARRELAKVHEGKGSAAVAEKALSESRAALRDVREASKEVAEARTELQSPAKLTPPETRLVERVLAVNRQGRLFNIPGDTSADRRASSLLPGLVERMHLMLVQSSKTRGQGYAVPGHMPPERAPSQPPPATTFERLSVAGMDDPHQREKLMSSREISIRAAAIGASHGEAISAPEPTNPTPVEERYLGAREQFLRGRQTLGWDELEKGDALLLERRAKPKAPPSVDPNVRSYKDAMKLLRSFEALQGLNSYPTLQHAAQHAGFSHQPNYELEQLEKSGVIERVPPGERTAGSVDMQYRLLSGKPVASIDEVHVRKAAAVRAEIDKAVQPIGLDLRDQVEHRSPSVNPVAALRLRPLTVDDIALDIPARPSKAPPVHHPDPPLIQAFRKAVLDWELDNPRRVPNWESLGWTLRQVRSHVEIWSRDGYRAMVMFGGKKKLSHLFQWVPPEFAGEGWPPNEERAGAGNVARPALLDAAPASARKPPRRGGGAASSPHEGGEATPSGKAKPAKPPKAKVSKVRKPPKPKKPKVAQLKRWTCEGLVRVGCGGGGRVVGVRLPRVKATIFTRI